MLILLLLLLLMFSISCCWLCVISWDLLWIEGCCPQWPGWLLIAYSINCWYIPVLRVLKPQVHQFSNTTSASAPPSTVEFQITMKNSMYSYPQSVLWALFFGQMWLGLSNVGWHSKSQTSVTVWLFSLSGRHFEETFENTQRKKVLVFYTSDSYCRLGFIDGRM